MADLPAARIDRSSPLPFYFQLRQLLAAEIASGRWPQGVQIRSEPEICDHFGLSRTTVRQALASLESDGLIRREKGRGTFVSQVVPEAWFLQSSQGFHEEASSKGHRVTSQVLRREVGEVPAWAVAALQLRGGNRGLTLERLRWVDERMVMYVVNHLPEDLAEAVLAADLETGSLYGELREREGVIVVGGRRIVEAAAADERLATLLEVEPGAPLLYVESVSWDEERRPIECYRAWHRADRTKIEVQVLHEDLASQAGLDRTTLRLGVT